jgi:transposase
LRMRRGRQATGWRGSLDLAGVGCIVAAPGKIERPAADRVKTGQRDAERVLRLLMIDGLHAVRVPSGQEEALREVVRAREAVRGDLMRAPSTAGQAAATPRRFATRTPPAPGLSLTGRG